MILPMARKLEKSHFRRQRNAFRDDTTHDVVPAESCIFNDARVDNRAAFSHKRMRDARIEQRGLDLRTNIKRRNGTRVRRDSEARDLGVRPAERAEHFTHRTDMEKVTNIGILHAKCRAAHRIKEIAKRLCSFGGASTAGTKFEILRATSFLRKCHRNFAIEVDLRQFRA